MIDESQIDRTGATLTPEQAGKVEVVEKKEEVVVAEVEPKEEVKEPSNEEPEEKKEPEKEPESPEPLKEKRSIYEDYKEKKNEVKEAKEQIKTLMAEKEALLSEKAKLEELANQLKGAENKSEKAEVAEDIKAFAESIGADPDAIGKLESFLKSRISKVDNSLSKEDVELIKQIKSKEAKLAEQESFQREWSEFVPSLKKDNPNISDAELLVLQKEFDKLAHTKGFNDKELDYIYYRNKDALSKLISPKKKSFESAGNPSKSSESPSFNLSSKASPMDVQNFVQQEKRNPSQLVIKKGHIVK
jgi:hypothetical protein